MKAVSGSKPDTSHLAAGSKNVASSTHHDGHSIKAVGEASVQVPVVPNSRASERKSIERFKVSLSIRVKTFFSTMAEEAFLLARRSKEAGQRFRLGAMFFVGGGTLGMLVGIVKGAFKALTITAKGMRSSLAKSDRSMQETLQSVRGVDSQIKELLNKINACKDEAGIPYNLDSRDNRKLQAGVLEWIEIIDNSKQSLDEIGSYRDEVKKLRDCLAKLAETLVMRVELESSVSRLHNHSAALRVQLGALKSQV